MLYHYETKKINQAVKRNIERFPENFCFQLTENEFQVLRCQFVTLNNNGRGQHKKYLPYVFTEQGIAMLSALLKSDIAVNVSINIMKAFIEMRKVISNNSNIFNLSTKMEHKFIEYDKKFDIVFDELAFYDLNNLPNNMIPYVKEAIEEYKKSNPFSIYGW